MGAACCACPQAAPPAATPGPPQRLTKLCAISLPCAGVYEFSLSTERSQDRRIKVYVGESGSILLRHRQQYANDGDHLNELIDQALRDGMLIWRRVCYVSSKETAQNFEARWLERCAGLAGRRRQQGRRSATTA